MKKYILFLMLLMLCSTVFAASTFEVSIENGGNIDVDVGKYVNITIENKLSGVQHFKVYHDDLNWVYLTDPTWVKFSQISIDGNSNYTFRAFLKPQVELIKGINRVKFQIINLDSGEKLYFDTEFNVLKGLGPSYNPDLSVSISALDNVDPREPFTFYLLIKNKNSLNIDNAQIMLNSKYFNKIENISINGSEEKRIPYVINFDEKQAPGEDVIEGLVKVGDISFTPSKRTYHIIDYTTEINPEVTTKSDSFFKTVKEYKFENNGNNVKQQILKVPVPKYSRVFSSVNPKYESIISDVNGTFYGYSVMFNPGDSLVVVKTVNYRGLFYLLLFGLIAYVFFYITKSPITITKTVKNVKLNEGGISQLKISVIVKNHSNKAYKEVTVMDKIPNIASLKSENTSGSLSPSKVMRHKNGGFVLYWEIGEVDPFEERIITYSIKSKLSILGNFMLPLALVKFRLGDKLKKVKSNRLTITT